ACACAAFCFLFLFFFYCSGAPPALPSFPTRRSSDLAGFLRPNPYGGRMLHHPDYEPFWNAAEELDVAIGLHEGASGGMPQVGVRSEEHTSELQSPYDLVCRLLLEKKKKTHKQNATNC